MPSKGNKARQVQRTAPAARRRGKWSEKEVAQLRRHYGVRSDEQIAAELGRTLASVRATAATVFLARVRRGPWSQDEIERLKDRLGVSPTSAIAKVLGRTVLDIEKQTQALAAVQRPGRWSPLEVQQLRRLYGRRTDEDLARILGRSMESVRRQATRYALAKDKAFVKRLPGTAATRMPRWTKEELEQLRVLYPIHANLDIARKLTRSVKSVVSKAHHLGLKKDEDRLREMGRENVSRRYSRGS